MKKLLLMLAFSVLGFYGIAQDAEEDNKPGPELIFEEKSHDFGDIHQGDQVEHVFSFENSGDAPLVLTNVQTTCGCTAPKWPRQPIPPGQKGEITVKFNSAGKIGKQHKVIKIISNAKTPVTQISITTNILPKEKTDTD